LAAGPSSALAETAFAQELAAAPYLLEGLSYADLAHLAALVDAGAVDADRGRKLLAALLDLHPVPSGLVLDPAVGDLYNNRDAHLARLLGDDAGLVHLGRARREATTVAWQLAVRTRLLLLGESLVGLAGMLLRLATEHRATIMPDYTYLQQAHPTTLAHYLLGFAYPFERDLQRASRALALVNRSPAGSGSVNGSRFDVDRTRLAELLGFDGVVEHTRDAMWAPDLAAETLTVVVTTLTNVDRLAEDLQVWATAEFGFVELDDADSRASVVMPQKKNPYSLAHLRGEARHELGRMVGVLAANLTPTGQPDNRYYAYVDVPAALDRAAGSVELLAGVLDRAVFSTERMDAAAGSGYLYATDLCDFLAVATGADNRTIHRIVGLAVRRAIEAGGVPVTADSVRLAAADLDQTLGAFDDAEFERNRAPEHLVALRRGLGGAGDAAMAGMLADLGDRLARHRAAVDGNPLRSFPETFVAEIRTRAEGADT
jgi:argininosuccinate lyase